MTINATRAGLPGTRARTREHRAGTPTTVHPEANNQRTRQAGMAHGATWDQANPDTTAAAIPTKDGHRTAGPESPTNDPDSSTMGHLGSIPRLNSPSPRTPASKLPMPVITASEHRDAMYYTVTAMDIWGRIADRSALTTLRWRPGDRIAVSVAEGAVMIRPQRDGRQVITQQGFLRLPATVRHLTRLRGGDRILLAACSDRDLLLAYSMAALDDMVKAFHSSATGRRSQ